MPGTRRSPSTAACRCPGGCPAPSTTAPPTSTASSTSRRATERPTRGDKVLLVPGHCDPTVNLHDWYVGVRGLGDRRRRVWRACGRWRPAARCSDFVRQRCEVATVKAIVQPSSPPDMVAHRAPREDAMTPEERQLIAGLFDRMRSYGAPDKDREAEALISAVGAGQSRRRLHARAVGAGAGAGPAGGQRPRRWSSRSSCAPWKERAPAPRSGSFLGGAVGQRPARRGAQRRSVPAGRRARDAVGLRRAVAPWSQGAAAGAAATAGTRRRPAAASCGRRWPRLRALPAAWCWPTAIRNMLGGGGAHASPSTLAGPREGADAEIPGRQRQRSRYRRTIPAPMMPTTIRATTAAATTASRSDAARLRL